MGGNFSKFGAHFSVGGLGFEYTNIELCKYVEFFSISEVLAYDVCIAYEFVDGFFLEWGLGNDGEYEFFDEDLLARLD